jgi:hypothetical protein
MPKGASVLDKPGALPSEAQVRIPVIASIFLPYAIFIFLWEWGGCL